MKTICLILLLHFSATAERVHEPYFSKQEIILSATSYTFKVITISPDRFGYEIYAEKKLFIRQLTIPGVAGNYSFNRKTDAANIARLVITKLLKGETPPSVQKHELEAYHIVIK